MNFDKKYSKNHVDIDVQRAILEVGMAGNPLIAMHAFQHNWSLLKDWRIIYATEDNYGPFKLRRHNFSNKGFVSTLFRGVSLGYRSRSCHI